MDRGAGQFTVHRITRVRHDLAHFLSYTVIRKSAQCNLGKNAKQPRCPRADWTNKLWSVHMVEYYTAVKISETKICGICSPLPRRQNFVCVCVSVWVWVKSQKKFWKDLYQGNRSGYLWGECRVLRGQVKDRLATFSPWFYCWDFSRGLSITRGLDWGRQGVLKWN